jgi:hypothetical protein
LSAPLAVKVTESPAHIEELPVIATTGLGLGFTTMVNVAVGMPH